jgi:hypothetical protein
MDFSVAKFQAAIDLRRARAGVAAKELGIMPTE